MQFTVEQLAVSTSAPIMNAQMYHGHLAAAMQRFEIDTPLRAAAFFATVGIESAHLTATEESLYYRDAERLVRIYRRAFKTADDAVPYVRNPKGLSELLYKGYHGRGLIQLTWLANYQRATDALGVDYVNDPDKLKTPEHAALSAAWYWDDVGCNRWADLRDMDRVTELVNGPAKMHLAERKSLYEIATGVLHA